MNFEFDFGLAVFNFSITLLCRSSTDDFGSVLWIVSTVLELRKFASFEILSLRSLLLDANSLR